ncbi:MAG: hypothetical protein R3D02_05990 [Hyphomicrobiales bacterium]
MQDFFDRFDDFVADKNRAMPKEAFERFMFDVKRGLGKMDSGVLGLPKEYKIQGDL